ncbi:hypothetical protein BHE74_00023282 [Ensete ventricosum]|uniref:Uncharacterized protein n=1 Tax=Ensete ventricosum TaxID=4639 RepID=A0A444D005_ENSVE|nr:hypothetical protein GW17_00046268 [Ensete ventricosum]RWW69146.1 hypothetical protein BHE74_00023282 [Ensete ventricosum]RZR72532.1 hypothetical protein BHM03_00014448 [Ensete ventricosum]
MPERAAWAPTSEFPHPLSRVKQSAGYRSDILIFLFVWLLFADWGPKIDVVGFCFLDLASNYEPPESLVDWLNAGEKPVYIGFGSLKDVIFSVAEPKDYVYLLDNVPHDWLFLQSNANLQVKENAVQLAKAMETEDGVSGAVKAFLKHLPPKISPQVTPEPSSFMDFLVAPMRRCFGCT